jgi:tetratricopeptide (TPR) repeat protein
LVEQPEDDEPTLASPPRWRALVGWLLGGRAPGADPLDAPRRIGRYRVLEPIGEGGMGRVLLAEDEDLRRKVALKTLKRMDDSARRRFLREARAAARVSHPNVCPIFEVGEEGGRPFLAMELLKGETLAGRLRRGPLSPPEAMALATDLLAALSAMHDEGLVHRDVKPSNVFLTPHGAKLLDFGLAREVPSDVGRALVTATDLTSPGLIIGTPGYMAPEQILGRPVDARADIFAAGAVLYESLSGQRPFSGASAVQALTAALYEEPPSLSGSPALAALDPAVQRALSKQPGQRYSTAREMAEALRQAARASGAETPAPPRETFVGRQAELSWLQERFLSAAGGAGSVVLLTGERGVGKSALATEFLRWVREGATPVTLVAGRCTEAQGPGEAFLPFLDAVGRLLTSRAHDFASELLRKYAPTICVQMPAGLLPDPDGALRGQTAGATRERLIREGGDFMEAACRAFPVVLYLEDMQWADPASVDLLHHVGCRIARQRFLILTTLRQADVDAGNPKLKRCILDLVARGAARELALGALEPADAAAYLDARFPSHRFPGELAGLLHARTEGLALFMRALVDTLEERGDVVRGERGFVLARPAGELDLEPTLGLQDLVRQQLEGLDASERAVLEVASVAGREFLSPVVSHLVADHEPKAEQTLRRLCRVRRLLVEGSEETLPDGTLATRYRFAHGLYQAVLRDDLVSSRRVELHRQVAARLRHHWGSEAPRLATEIARHCEEGRDFAGAVTFRGYAGDNAAHLFAAAEAEAHYDWAIRLADHLGAPARAAALIGLFQRRGAVRLAQIRFDDATADFEAMRAKAREAGAKDAERAALAVLCDALFFARRVEEMAARTQELLEASTREGGADAAEAQARVGQVLFCEGRLREAVPVLDQVIASARRSGPQGALQIGLSYRGLAHYWQTEYVGTEACCVEAIALASRRGDGFYALAARMFLGLARANLGRISDALLDFGDAMAVARRNDDRYWLPRLVSHLGWVHRELGDFARAREHDAEAVRLAREQPLWGPESEALLNLSVDDVRTGHPERASALLAELEARAAATTWLRWISELRLAAASTEHWAARGDPARTLEHATRLAERARRVGARDYRCAAERHRAGAALDRGEGLEEAERRLGAALAELRTNPAPFEVWKSARVLAHLRRRLADEEGARSALAESARAIRTIASGTRDDELRAAFLGQGPVLEVVEAVPEGVG